MSVSASTAVQTLRAEQRRLSRGAAMPRLWRAMRGEWQRRMDRATARLVRDLGHAGVTEDYRRACGGIYR